MQSNYKTLGNYIVPVKVKNADLKASELLGINIDKFFMPSVANVVGTDLSRYKVVEKNQFACNRMHVGRDYRIPVALSDRNEPFMVSPAYDVFEIKDTSELLPEYLMMWFSRAEFDRNAWFYTDADVRGGLSWDAFSEMKLPVPDIEKQHEIVTEYNTVKNRIALNNQLIQKLEETAQAIYKQWFVDFEFPDENGNPYKSSGGKMVWNEELEKEIPEGWEVKTIDKIGEVVDSLHKTPEYSSTGLPMVRITDVGPGFLNLSEAMLVDENVFDEFSRNHKSSKGDIIVSRVGATFGEFSYAYTNDKFCLGQNTAVIIPKSLDSTILFTALSSSGIRNQIDQKVVGSAYSTLSLKDIRELKITLPNKELWTILKAVTNKFNILFDNQGFCYQELTALTEIQNFLLLKLATIEN